MCSDVHMILRTILDLHWSHFSRELKADGINIYNWHYMWMTTAQEVYLSLQNIVYMWFCYKVTCAVSQRSVSDRLKQTNCPVWRSNTRLSSVPDKRGLDLRLGLISAPISQIWSAKECHLLSLTAAGIWSQSQMKIPQRLTTWTDKLR